jgi:hypothetical protein
MALDQTQPLLVKVVREAGLDFFTLTLPDNSSEEIDAEEAVEWFRLHHQGKMDYTLIERAIDDAWNFGEANILIDKPRFPKQEVTRTTPNI